MPDGVKPEQSAFAATLAAEKQKAKRTQGGVAKSNLGPAPSQGGLGATAGFGAGLTAGPGGGATLPMPAPMAEPRASEAAAPGAEGEAQAGRASQTLARLQQLAMKHTQAKLAGAKGTSETEMRAEQIKRIMKTASDFKKIIRLGSASTPWTIIYMYLSLCKDYLLGNLVSGDPTGLFVKKKSIIGVTPLSFPEVLILWFVAASQLFYFLATVWPIIVIGLVILAISQGKLSDIKDLVDYLGKEFLNPVLEYFSLTKII
jgi:hypothetical protein